MKWDNKGAGARTQANEETKEEERLHNLKKEGGGDTQRKKGRPPSGLGAATSSGKAVRAGPDQTTRQDHLRMKWGPPKKRKKQ